MIIVIMTRAKNVNDKTLDTSTSSTSSIMERGAPFPPSPLSLSPLSMCTFSVTSVDMV